MQRLPASLLPTLLLLLLLATPSSGSDLWTVHPSGVQPA
jgi:hypothetical protein